MSYTRYTITDDTVKQSMMSSLRHCYGDLNNPDFRTVAATMGRDPHRSLIETLRGESIEIKETTDLNDDVSTQLIASREGDTVYIELSAVGPFAIVRQTNGVSGSRWVTRSDNALTPLGAVVAASIQCAGLYLLDRNTVTQRLQMTRFDGGQEATFYQALFTDTEVVP